MDILTREPLTKLVKGAIIVVYEQSKHHAYKAHFLIMIELTTGVVFLMSSLYGSGHADNHVARIDIGDRRVVTVAAASSTSPITVDSNEIRDPKIMETYLKIKLIDEPLLVDIAKCESNFKQFDKNGKLIRGLVDSNDVGVFQINERYHLETSKKLGMDIYTVDGNIEYAKYLYKKSNSAPWSASAACWSPALATL